MASPITSPMFDLHLPISQPPFPSKNRSLIFKVLCNKSDPKTVPNNTTTNNPSLCEQLKPLSLTTLTKNEPNLLLPKKPKSTWVNPTKPKPSVLTLHRQKRSPYSYNPKIRTLKAFTTKLNGCSSDSQTELSEAISQLPNPPTREDALLILNSLRPWEKTLFFFDWIKAQNLFPLETIMYNVVMKSLRFGRQFGAIEGLAFEMIENGVELDNITYSTIITSAKRCGLHEKALEWFERMYRTGLMPDEVTYSAVLDVYAKLGKVEEVLSLYERGRSSGWRPDNVAFGVLAKMFGEAGDYDGIRFVLQEMKGIGVEPNMVVYNVVLEALGKAGKPGLAKALFEEMVGLGLTPNEKTLTALVKIYGKARWGRDALDLWEKMRLNKWPMDFILYNSLLSMCADLGLVEEGERLFEEMKKSSEGSCRPDSWSYTAMLNIYGSGGEVEKAMAMFEEMCELGVKVNVMGCTCLVQCLGRARRIDDVVRVLEVSIDRGVEPDDRLCGCLLSVVSFCDNRDDVSKVMACLEKSNPKLAAFVELLGEEGVSIDKIREEFKGVLNEAAVEVRRPYCNCLIDICRNRISMRELMSFFTWVLSMVCTLTKTMTAQHGNGAVHADDAKPLWRAFQSSTGHVKSGVRHLVKKREAKQPWKDKGEPLDPTWFVLFIAKLFFESERRKLL
ncbi:hypothetical protein Scep_026861 [Stephania cephalantha]|uniref:Pentatricopeptide repeat-containing protein n=1 Tax=Stephania cephalantha TaxID=152367 RepID=A0AAP0EP52_9MAGN